MITVNVTYLTEVGALFRHTEVALVIGAAKQARVSHVLGMLPTHVHITQVVISLLRHTLIPIRANIIYKQ